jgi:hypothetical protein
MLLSIDGFPDRSVLFWSSQWSSVSISDLLYRAIFSVSAAFQSIRALLYRSIFIGMCGFFLRHSFMRNLKKSVIFRKPLVELEHVCYTVYILCNYSLYHLSWSVELSKSSHIIVIAKDQCSFGLEAIFLFLYSSIRQCPESFVGWVERFVRNPTIML